MLFVASRGGGCYQLPLFPPSNQPCQTNRPRQRLVEIVFPARRVMDQWFLHQKLDFVQESNHTVMMLCEKPMQLLRKCMGS